MAETIYCCNTDCGFEDCEHHRFKGIEAWKRGEAYVKVSALGPTCRRYIGSLVEEAVNELLHYEER